MTETSAPELSVVIPVFNERENVGPLVEEVRAALIDGGIAAELIVVDDASTDATKETLRALEPERSWLKTLALPSRSGQSAALAAGIRAASGRFVATLDGDLQNDPADLLRMLEILRRDEADLVQGVRVSRQDAPARKAASLLGRLARRLILGSRLADTGCATRILRAEIAREVPLQFRGMHRFLPVYVELTGARVLEIPVAHRARPAGKTKYGIFDRALPSLIDCIAVRWMKARYRASRVAGRS